MSPTLRLWKSSVTNVMSLSGALTNTPTTSALHLVYCNTSQSPFVLNPSHIISPSCMAPLSAISSKLFSLYAVAVTSSNLTYPAVDNLNSKSSSVSTANVLAAT